MQHCATGNGTAATCVEGKHVSNRDERSPEPVLYTVLRLSLLMQSWQRSALCSLKSAHCVIQVATDKTPSNPTHGFIQELIDLLENCIAHRIL